MDHLEQLTIRRHRLKGDGNKMHRPLTCTVALRAHSAMAAPIHRDGPAGVTQRIRLQRRGHVMDLSGPRTWSALMDGMHGRGVGVDVASFLEVHSCGTLSSETMQRLLFSQSCRYPIEQCMFYSCGVLKMRKGSQCLCVLRSDPFVAGRGMA